MNKCTMKYNRMNFKTGDSVTCTITNKKIKNAKIYVISRRWITEKYGVDETTEKVKSMFYICQNIVEGTSLCDRLGYMFGYMAELDLDGEINRRYKSSFKNLALKTKEENSLGFSLAVGSIIGMPASERQII